MALAHAYLSNPGLRTPKDCGYVRQWPGILRSMASAAEVEARAILEVTEPACGCAFDHLYGRCAGATVDVPTLRAYVGERRVLAEALAAVLPVLEELEAASRA